jgi:hypothetical protein
MNRKSYALSPSLSRLTLVRLKCSWPTPGHVRCAPAEFALRLRHGPRKQCSRLHAPSLWHRLWHFDLCGVPVLGQLHVQRQDCRCAASTLQTLPLSKCLPHDIIARVCVQVPCHTELVFKQFDLSYLHLLRRVWPHQAFVLVRDKLLCCRSGKCNSRRLGQHWWRCDYLSWQTLCYHPHHHAHLGKRSCTVQPNPHET